MSYKPRKIEDLEVDDFIIVKAINGEPFLCKITKTSSRFWTAIVENDVPEKGNKFVINTWNKARGTGDWDRHYDRFAKFKDGRFVASADSDDIFDAYLTLLARYQSARDARKNVAMIRSTDFNKVSHDTISKIAALLREERTK